MIQALEDELTVSLWKEIMEYPEEKEKEKEKDIKGRRRRYWEG